MGNSNTTFKLSNCSSRNVRVFVREEAQALDAFITPQPGPKDDSQSVSPADKKFTFIEDVTSVRLLASQTQAVPWDPNRFLSVFVEDEDDANVCAKMIINSMSLSSSFSLLLYDV